MDSSQAGREFFPRARVSILSAYIGTYLYVGTRAPTTVARHIKNRWHLGETWSFWNLLSFTPLPPSKNFLRYLKICRLRSGWGPICAVCCVHGALGRNIFLSN